MTLKQAINYFGSRKNLCDALKITKGALTHWNTKEMPELSQRRLEEMTGGALKINRKFRCKSVKGVG